MHIFHLLSKHIHTKTAYKNTHVPVSTPAPRHLDLFCPWPRVDQGPGRSRGGECKPDSSTACPFPQPPSACPPRWTRQSANTLCMVYDVFSVWCVECDVGLKYGV